jgi:hypothetical protein
MCPTADKLATLQWYGYAIDGVGFHSLELDDSLLEAPGSLDATAATVIINDPELHVKMTPSLLDQDLKQLANESWDWKVKQLNQSDFLVVFPNEASLKLCKNAGGMTLPVSKIGVIFAKPKANPSFVVTLAKIWILLHDVPACLRKAELLLEGTKMLGRLSLVDEDSLNKEGPVRMLFHSHCPDKVPSHMLLFANLKGFKIRHSFHPHFPLSCEIPPSNMRDKDQDEDDER